MITRGKNERRGDIRYVTWDAKSPGDWKSELERAAAVINLAGRNINCWFTKEHRRQILSSRVDSTSVLANAIARSDDPPSVFVQASGIGYYGNSDERFLDEGSQPGSDFMAEVCQGWENAAADALTLSATRKVILRIGIVLDPRRRCTRGVGAPNE